MQIEGIGQQNYNVISDIEDCGDIEKHTTDFDTSSITFRSSSSSEDECMHQEEQEEWGQDEGGKEEGSQEEEGPGDEDKEEGGPGEKGKEERVKSMMKRRRSQEDEEDKEEGSQEGEDKEGRGIKRGIKRWRGQEEEYQEEELVPINELLEGSDEEEEDGPPFIIPRRYVHRKDGKFRGITQTAFERQCNKVWDFYFYLNPLPPPPKKGDYSSFKISLAAMKNAQTHAFNMFQSQLHTVQSNYYNVQQVLKMRMNRSFPNMTALYNLKY